MLDISKREVGKVSILSLNGDLDIEGVQNLKVYIQSLFTEDTQKVIINWANVHAVSCTSIQQMPRPLHDLVAHHPTAFCGLSDALKKSLKTAPFFEKVKLFDSEERALTRM